MNKVLNLGMEIRQNQLDGTEPRSGNEVLKEMWSKSKLNKLKTQ